MFRNSIRPGLALGITPELLSVASAGLTVATSNFSCWPKAAAAPSQHQIDNRRTIRYMIDSPCFPLFRSFLHAMSLRDCGVSDVFRDAIRTNQNGRRCGA